jgi:putative flippase GtrA
MEQVKQFVRYGLVGGVNTVVGAGLMVFGAWLGWHYVFYTLFGYGVAFGVSFALNFHFTFRVSGAVGRRMGRFLGVNVLNLLLVQALQAWLIEQQQVMELYAVAAGIVLYTGLGFYLNRRFVFAHSL